MTGQIVGFVIFIIASLAELSRIPFDMPIAESELTMGYLTEYSGLRFTMFFLGEYAGMVSMAAIASTLFLGGYWFPGLERRRPQLRRAVHPARQGHACSSSSSSGCAGPARGCVRTSSRSWHGSG